MEKIILRLTGPKINETEIKATVVVSEGEDYHSALSRGLKKAQDDFNSILTDIVDKDKKRIEGTTAVREAKKMKKDAM